MKFGIVGFLLSTICLPTISVAQDQNRGWHSEWEVERDFRIDADTLGFQLPTAIAFVPSPGTAPDDPLYFVTELKGSIKVVTNDRTVHYFAQNLTELQPDSQFPMPQMPQGFAEQGVTGLCLAPEHGFVFVTFNYLDSDGVLRNNIVRFSTVPLTFSITPSTQVSFTEIFARDRSANSHMIGACQVVGRELYVGVGDALDTPQAQFLGTTQGKVLRMSLDGDPQPDNPFYVNSARTNPTNYVFAYGFRNPFGLEIVRDRVFVSENGQNIDRFLEIERGGNYLWNGHDWSIGARAVMVFSPAVSPTSTEFYPEGASIFPPTMRNKFYIALAGHPGTRGPGQSGQKSIVSMGYDFNSGMVTNVPQHLVRYRGNENQSLVAMAFGPDGLYFAPLLADTMGQTPIIRLSWSPDSPHHLIIGTNIDARTLIGQKQCRGCHVLGSRGGKAGPNITRSQLVPRLKERLNSNEYSELMAQLDKDQTVLAVSYREARAEVLAAEGIERVRRWLKYRLLEPRFDNPNATMPNLGLSESEAEVLAGYLVNEIPQASILEPLLGPVRRTLLIRVRRKTLAVGFILGLLVVPTVLFIRRMVGGKNQ